MALTKAERMKALKKHVKDYSAQAKKDGTDEDDAVLHFGLEDYGRLPTGVPAVDKLLGGGFPRGKIATIAGPEQTCKGTTVLRAIGNEQKNDGNACYVDAEHALDGGWAEKQGVNMDELLIVEKDTLENMLDKTLSFVREKLITILVIDSIAALLPRSELEGKEGTARSMNDDTIGILQRKMGQFLRLVCGPACKSHTAVVMLGQVYQDINSYGGIEQVKGGNAVKHFTHIRLMTRRGPKAEAPVEKVDGKDRLIGFMTYFKLGKTRMTGTLNEGSEAKMPFLFDIGFDDIGYFIEYGIASGKIARDGAWYTLGNHRVQGRDALRALVLDDAEAKHMLLV